MTLISVAANPPISSRQEGTAGALKVVKEAREILPLIRHATGIDTLGALDFVRRCDDEDLKIDRASSVVPRIEFHLSPSSPSQYVHWLKGNAHVAGFLEALRKCGKESVTADLTRIISAPDERQPFTVRKLTFPSSFLEAPFDGAQSVYAHYLLPNKIRGKAPAVVLCSFGEGDYLGQIMSLSIATRGAAVLEVVMPMWGQRAPQETWGKPSWQRYRRLITNAEKFNEVILESMADTFVAVRWLRSQDGIDGARLGIAGYSNKGSIAASVLLLDPMVKHALAVAAVPVYANDFWSDENLIKRFLTRNGVDRIDFGRSTAGINLLSIAEAFRARPGSVTLTYAKHDESVPASDYDKLMRALGSQEYHRENTWHGKRFPGAMISASCPQGAEILDELLSKEILRKVSSREVQVNSGRSLDETEVKRAVLRHGEESSFGRIWETLREFRGVRSGHLSAIYNMFSVVPPFLESLARADDARTHAQKAAVGEAMRAQHAGKDVSMQTRANVMRFLPLLKRSLRGESCLVDGFRFHFDASADGIAVREDCTRRSIEISDSEFSDAVGATSYFLVNNPADKESPYLSGDQVASIRLRDRAVVASQRLIHLLEDTNHTDYDDVGVLLFTRESLRLVVFDACTAPAEGGTPMSEEDADRFAKAFGRAVEKILSGDWTHEDVPTKLDRFVEKAAHEYRRSKEAFSGRGLILRPSASRAPIVETSSPILDHMLSPWNQDYFLTPRLPIRVGMIEDPEAFSSRQALPRVNNMPLKLVSEGNEYHVPIELERFTEPIRMMVDYLTAVNPRIDEYNAYLTINQGVVVAGKTQRHPEIHVDGIQGARYPVKILPCLTFTVTDALPTKVFYQPFDFSKYNVNTDDFRKPMQDQAREENARLLDTYTLYLWDPYVVHQASVAKEDTFRTFLRLEFSPARFDSLGDTKSPLLRYDWEYFPRAIAKTLQGYVVKKADADSGAR